MATELSLLQGPVHPPLMNLNIGQLLDQQTRSYGDRVHVTSVWQNTKLTYRQFSENSKILAKALLGCGLKRGDNVGVFLGNSYQYLEIMGGAGRIGGASVSFNLTYTDVELRRAAEFTECKVVFITTNIGDRDLSKHIAALLTLPQLTHLVIVNGDRPRQTNHVHIHSYENFRNVGPLHVGVDNARLKQAESEVQPSDVFNIQFTSGTTGFPKAALLTQHNMINNANLISKRKEVTVDDRMVCPAPLFHCLGSVAGWLVPLCNGASIVLAAEMFNPLATVEAIISTSGTVTIGVPAMYVAMAEAAQKQGLQSQLHSLRRAMIAGSPVAPSLAAQVASVLGAKVVTNAYGMTELSPCAFLPYRTPEDVDHQVHSVGKIMPHTRAKIADPSTGEPLPVGTRGELCVAGYLVCAGYLKNAAKTNETIRRDAQGTLWLHTGDECYFAADGSCYITGRIKDIIIRAGENIYPGEIESRLIEHPAIAEAAVFGVADDRVGEAVACVLRAADDTTSGSTRRTTQKEVQEWVAQTLGRHKVPRNVFWLGHGGFCLDYPKTGSGKIQKFELKNLVERLGGKDGETRVVAKL